MIILFLLLQADTVAQQPCTQADANHKPGSWGREGDDLANADRTFPKDQYPLVLKKADRVIALLKQAVPRLTGVEARPYRSISGKPYVADGPVPFGVSVPVFAYYCIPTTSGAPELRGKVELSGETGTWIYFYFNSLGRLASNSFAVHTVNGARIFRLPKYSEEIKGYTVLVPERYDGSRDEAIIITPDGQLPYRPLSREKYLLARQKASQAEVDRLLKLTSISPSGLAQRQSELASITNLLNSLSESEKQLPAVISDINAFPGGRKQMFISEAQGGFQLVTIDAKLFEPTSSRTAIKIITVFWEYNPRDVLKANAIQQLKDNLDVAALKQMLDR
jgi:hypothetical protein